jgi:hypothetical protein
VLMGRTILLRKDRENMEKIRLWEKHQKKGMLNDLKKSIMGPPKPVEKPESDHEYLIEEIEQKNFTSSLIFSKKILYHHFPHVYEKGLFGKTKVVGL